MRTPSMHDLVTAVRERMDTAGEHPVTGFEARVIRNVLLIIERETQLGPSINAAHSVRCAALGAADDAELAAAIRRGDHDSDLSAVTIALLASATDQLRIDNPRW